MDKILIELIPEKDKNFIEHWCKNPNCKQSKYNQTGIAVMIHVTEYTGNLLFCSLCAEAMDTLPYRMAYIEYMLNDNDKTRAL